MLVSRAQRKCSGKKMPAFPAVSVLRHAVPVRLLLRIIKLKWMRVNVITVDAV